MALERQDGFSQLSPSIERLWTIEKSSAPVIILSSEQAQLVYRGNQNIDMPGIPIAKPWETQYRGEVFIYIPKKEIKVPIKLDPYEFSEAKIGKGLIGIVNLTSIAYIKSDSEWEESFHLHKESARKPFKKTYLWFLDPVHHFLNPVNIKIMGRWWSPDEMENQDFENKVLCNLGNYVLPQERRSLHSLSIHSFLYNYRG